MSSSLDAIYKSIENALLIPIPEPLTHRIQIKNALSSVRLGRAGDCCCHPEPGGAGRRGREGEDVRSPEPTQLPHVRPTTRAGPVVILSRVEVGEGDGRAKDLRFRNQPSCTPTPHNQSGSGEDGLP